MATSTLPLRRQQTYAAFLDRLTVEVGDGVTLRRTKDDVRVTAGSGTCYWVILNSVVGGRGYVPGEFGFYVAGFVCGGPIYRLLIASKLRSPTDTVDSQFFNTTTHNLPVSGNGVYDLRVRDDPARVAAVAVGDWRRVFDPIALAHQQPDAFEKVFSTCAATLALQDRLDEIEPLWAAVANTSAFWDRPKTLPKLALMRDALAQAVPKVLAG